MELSHFALALQKIVLARIEKNRLVVPPLPTVVTAVMAQLGDPNTSFKQLAETLGRDPLLTAQVLRTANSAAYGTGTRTLEQAVSRLGSQWLKARLIEFSAARLFESRESEIKSQCNAVWEHSRAVGLLARDLSALAGSEDAEAAYLGGLLHDVGKPVLAALLLEAERHISVRGARWIGGAQWTAIIADTHRAVGVALAERWCLPGEVMAAIRDCDHYDETNRKSEANFVRYANALAKSLGLCEKAPVGDGVQALLTTGRELLGIDDTAIQNLSSTLLERLRAIA